MNAPTTSRTNTPRPAGHAVPWLLSGLLALASLAAGISWADVVTPGPGDAVVTGPSAAGPLPLRAIPVIEPPDLNDYLNASNPGGLPAARAAAIALGKALYWDVQLSSDAKVACASCHFAAGVDHRTRNTLHPGKNNTKFTLGSPNSVLTAAPFPFHQRQNPDFQKSRVTRDYKDMVGSQGVRLNKFVDIVVGQAEEIGTPIPDAVFMDHGKPTRRLTSRQAGTVINAAYYFSTFWDGRGNNIFNGVTPFGPADGDAAVFVNGASGLEKVRIRMRFAALASQAVGPPLSDIEMSYRGRTFPKIGKKMLSLKPLARQAVLPDESAIGVYADTATGKGLTVSYADLIQAAFAPRFWNNVDQHVTFAKPTLSINPFNPDNQVAYEFGVATFHPGPSNPADTRDYTQMECNFSLFLGLAIQLYEATLISDNSKFDQFQARQTSFTAEEFLGMNLFQDTGCGGCHAGPEFTSHSQEGIQGFNPRTLNPSGAIGVELQPRFGLSFVDEGVYNIGVRPTAEDLGRGGITPKVDPDVDSILPPRSVPLAYTNLASMVLKNKLPAEFALFVPQFTFNPRLVRRTDMTQGSFKVPTLRNIELTGPYFHTGQSGTLAQVVDFYTRGGCFPAKNARNLHPAIEEQFLLQGQPLRQRALVAFLLTLTDERVRQEAAPFDHPELAIPEGQDPNGNDLFITIPAVGAGGRAAQFLPPLVPFLNMDPFAE